MYNIKLRVGIQLERLNKFVHSTSRLGLLKEDVKEVTFSFLAAVFFNVHNSTRFGSLKMKIGSLQSEKIMSV